MNWLKKLLFSESNSKSSDNELIEEPKRKAANRTQVATRSNFRGLDYSFIDLIYFKDSSEKDEYLKSLNELFNSLGITNETLYTEAFKKLTEYDLMEPVEFIRDVILLPEYLPDANGIRKLNNSKTAFNFAVENVNRKFDRDFFNFDFEDNLISGIISKYDIHDYHYISTMTQMGIIHAMANNQIKRDEYFNFVLKEKDLSTISPLTVSEFFKTIGDYYNDCFDFSNALKWFQFGLELNPKLAVKKKISELVNKLGEIH